MSLKGQCFRSFCTIWSEKCRPISRLASKIVFCGFEVICALAASPIRRWSSTNATTDGVVRFPMSLGMISTFPSFHTPTQEYLPLSTTANRKRGSEIDADAVTRYAVSSSIRSLPFFKIDDMMRKRRNTTNR